MKKRIYIICGVAESYKLMYRIGSELERHWTVEPVYVYFRDYVHKYLVLKNIPEDRLKKLHQGIVYGEWDRKSYDLQYLEEMERLYGIPNLWLIWETVRNHDQDHSYENALLLLETVFRHYEKFVERENIDAVLTHVYPSTIPSYIFYNVLKRKGVKTHIFIPHRISGRFVVFNGFTENGFCDKYERVDEAFDELQKRDLTEEEARLARDFISTFREKRYMSVQERAIYTRKSVSFKRFGNMVKQLYSVYRYKTYRSMRWNNALVPLFWLFRRLMTIPRKFLLMRSRIFEKPDVNEKYVLCLLMKQPEASTLAKAPFYMDQVNFVHNLSKSLPIGYRLYVKPHHNDFGNQTYQYFKTMSQRPNIRMLSVNTNSHELVRHCSLVVTINGTVGWEGLLFNKPVITFGNVFYNSFPLVRKVSDFSQLPSVIRQMTDNYKPDEALLRKYIVANYQGSYEGSPIVPLLNKRLSASPSNIQKIAVGLADALRLQRRDNL